MIGQKGIPATYGGVERHVDELARRFAALGHDVRVYCRPHYTPEDAAIPGVRLVRLPSIATKHLDAISHVALASLHVLFTDADVVHYHALGPSSLAWLPRLFGKKVVVTVHGLDWRREKWGKVASNYLRFCEWTSTHLPHATIVVSQTLREHFGMHGRRVHYVPNGTPPPIEASEQGARTLGLEPGRYVLFVGRLVPEKGVHLLVEAHNKFAQDWTLAIAGEGHFTDEYVQRCREAAGEDVRFLGPVYGEELASLWQHAALVVLPSSMEGLSIALLEAMSYCRPVLASDIPENREVLEEIGEVFRSGDPQDLGRRLHELLRSPAKRSEMGKRGGERIRERYGWDRVVQQTANIYQSLSSTR
ncbi:MAG TPA: glycosyltransferase family 4 protein [bacterium]|nr:glycosyltransferase family 4 protein [bacterium]